MIEPSHTRDFTPMIGPRVSFDDPAWGVDPDDAPEDYLAAMVQEVVGLEIPIARFEGKWKMSQNREDGDRAGVIQGLGAADDPHRNPALAGQVAERQRPR